jgi:hypothetical protein
MSTDRMQSIRNYLITTPLRFISPRPTLNFLPRYIKLHAACTRVAHLSRAGDYAEQLLRDRERTAVLAEDGTSAQILVDAWTERAIIV